MKLAFCLFKYFPFGGLQRDFLRIARECILRGHTVDAYTMAWEGNPEPDISTHIIPMKGLQNHTRSKNFVKKLRPIFSKKRYDLIVGFNKMPGLDIYYAADTCFQTKSREEHGVWFRFTSRYRHLLAYEKSVFSAESKTNIFLISKLQQPEFMKWYKTPSERFHDLPPGISKDRVAPPNAEIIRKKLREELKIRDDEFLLLMIGSGFKAKGLDRILEGIASFPDDLKNRAHLFVIGKDHAELFQHQAEKLGISHQINFLGGREDVPQFLLAGDLLLHPAYNENTGTVLLEAIVAGLPIITTDICGYAHYVQEAEAGIVLTSPFEQTEFNAHLQNMLLSTKRSMWKENALAFSQTADIFSMPDHAVDLIESIGQKRAIHSKSRN